MSDQAADAINFHDNLARSWGDKYLKPSFQRRLRAFASMLPESLDAQKWLDAGCGTGSLSALLLERGATVLGVDGSSLMIDHARSMCRDARGRFEAIEDLQGWQPADRDWDGIVCSSVLEYVPAPEALLQQFLQWLQPSGILLLSVPNRLSAIRMAQRGCYRFTTALGVEPRPAYLAHSRHEFSRKQLGLLLARNGFVVDRWMYFGVPATDARLESPVTSPLLLLRAKRR